MYDFNKICLPDIQSAVIFCMKTSFCSAPTFLLIYDVFYNFFFIASFS